MVGKVLFIFTKNFHQKLFQREFKFLRVEEYNCRTFHPVKDTSAKLQ
jgi:hypothetical protein